MAVIARLRATAGVRQRIASGVLLAGSAATVGTALAFEHIGGYIPCALCLQQRTPYYVSIGLAATALLAGFARAPAVFVRVALLSIGLLMAYGLALGVYHAGVEWQFWAGPAGCASGGGADLSGDLLSSIDAIRPPACDRAAGRFLGLSFPGWNAVASLGLSGIALAAAFARARRAA